MRSLSIGAAMASAALMSMTSAASVANSVLDGWARPDPTDRAGRQSRPYSRKRVMKYRGPGQTKKLKGGLYKGSRWAKKATRLGGNPARF